MRVLLVVHGHEPPGWETEACRVVSRLTSATLRVLAILDVPAPAFTSLTPRAAGAHRAARTAWRRHEEIRVQGLVDRIMPLLPGAADVVPLASAQGDLVRTIAEQANGWPADLAVVGPPAPGLFSWFWPGPVHERVLRRLLCAVMVVPPPAPPPPGTAHSALGPRVVPPWRRPLTAKGGA
jgi:hypothetical protein